MLMQMCLAPLWKAYETLDAGADIGETLSRMIAKLNLVQVHTCYLLRAAQVDEGLNESGLQVI